MGERLMSFAAWVALLAERRAAGGRISVHEAALVDAGARSQHEAVAILAAVPAPRRSTTCPECERAAGQARLAGTEVPPVAQQEIATNRDGNKFRTALCAYHWDLDWSRRWQKAYDKAAGSDTTREALRAQAHKRARAGRMIYARSWESAPPMPAYPARTG